MHLVKLYRLSVQGIKCSQGVYNGKQFLNNEYFVCPCVYHSFQVMFVLGRVKKEAYCWKCALLEDYHIL